MAPRLMPYTASWNRLLSILVLLSWTQFAVRAQTSQNQRWARSQESLTTPARLGYYEARVRDARGTRAGDERCGWRVPAVKAEGVRRDSGTVWIVVVCLAGVFALGLM